MSNDFSRPLLLAAALAGCASPPPSAGHYAQVDGIRMYYELHGRGSPLLLLHGGAGSGAQFSKQIPDFEKRRLLIVPDCPEQGRTEGRDGPLTYHQMAEDMIALLDQLKLRRVDVMGWSDGGNIGLDMAMHHPERVGRLVTFGANFRPDGLNQADFDWGLTATPESFGAEMKETWQKIAPDPSRYLSAMKKILDLWRTLPDWTPAELGTIRAKVLVCAGEHDVVRPEHTRLLAASIPGAEVWIVPGASHSAMIERPDLVNPRVLAFLDK